MRLTKFALEFPSSVKLLEDVFRPNQIEPQSYLELYDFLLNSYENDSSNMIRLQTIISLLDKVIFLYI